MALDLLRGKGRPDSQRADTLEVKNIGCNGRTREALRPAALSDGVLRAWCRVFVPNDRACERRYCDRRIVEALWELRLSLA
jgi:hypothetical protein